MKLRWAVGLLAWALLGLSTLAALRVMGPAYLFNADALYLPALFRDLFQEGGAWSSWHLTPAPYFFPDMLLCFALGLLVSLWSAKVSALLVAFALAQTVLFGLALLAVARAVASPSSTSSAPTPPAGRSGLSALCALLATALLWASVTGHVEGLWLTLLSAIHFGTVLTALFSVAWLLSLWKRSTVPGLLGLALLACASAASDPLYLVVVTAPWLVLGLLAHRVERRAWTHTAKLLGALLGGSGLGLFVALRMTSRRAALGYATLRVQAFQREAHHLGELWTLRFTHQPLSSGLWVLGVLLALRLAVGGARRSRAQSSREQRLSPAALLAAYVLLAIAANYAAALLNATPDLVALVRYSQLSLLLPFILLASVSFQRLGQSGRLTLAMLLLPLLVVLWGEALRWRLTPIDVLGDYRHPLAACLDAHRDELGSGRGVSDYWQAKPVSLLSERGLKLVQLTDRNQPHLWINSQRWYLDEQDTRPYAFAVMRGLDRELFLLSYGPPEKTLRCDDAEVLVYAKDRRFDTQLRRDFRAALERERPR